MQKRCVDMAFLPWPMLRQGALPKKKGPLEDERPKSREETPKVGYDTFGRMPNHAVLRIWAYSAGSSTATWQPRAVGHTSVAMPQQCCCIRRMIQDSARQARVSSGAVLGRASVLEARVL